jgi:hypothetical protein
MGKQDTAMCAECKVKPALTDARFGGRCNDCAGQPMKITKSPKKKDEY